MPRVVGLDLSLTGTGVTRISSTGTWIADIHRFGTKPTPTDVASRAERLRTLTTRTLGLCAGADLVAIEAPAFNAKNPGSAHDRSGYWWLVCAGLTRMGIPVAEVVNNHLKTYILGKGSGAGTDKDNVLAATIKRYPTINIVSNDTADSTVLAAMAARHLGWPIEDSLPVTHLKAVTAVKWPPTQMEGT